MQFKIDYISSSCTIYLYVCFFCIQVTHNLQPLLVYTVEQVQCSWLNNLVGHFFNTIIYYMQLLSYSLSLKKKLYIKKYIYAIIFRIKKIYHYVHMGVKTDSNCFGSKSVWTVHMKHAHKYI